MSLTNLYILRLFDGRRFIGLSDDPVKAFVAHKEGGISAWTDRYIPERIELIQRNILPSELDRWVIRYMIQYGTENVRGGSWSTVRLTDIEQREIRRRITEERRDCCIQ